MQSMPVFSRHALTKLIGKPKMPDRPRILAIDDHEDILELIRMSLEGNYDVITTSNPVDIYEVMDIFEPDLLILDVMMPRVTGFQLIEILRKNPKTKDLPIIILSAKSTAGEIKHGYKLGATLYLTKPFQPERLVKNVETQFRVAAPSTQKKTNDLEQVAEQLENKPAFRKGTLHFSSNIQRREIIVDARKRMQEKILREEREAKNAGRDWES